jgi:hypothetical protein
MHLLFLMAFVVFQEENPDMDSKMIMSEVGTRWKVGVALARCLVLSTVHVRTGACCF